MFLQSRGKSRLIRISVWVAILGLLLGVLSSIIMATSAEAHAALESVSPKDGASLDVPPAKVVLTFNEPISTSFATVTVTGPSGPVSKGRAAVDGSVVTQALDGDLANGSYKVAYRVVSEDGHPVSDTSSFRVATQAAPSPTATTTTSAAAASSSSATAGPTPAGPGESPTPLADADRASDTRPLRIGMAVGVAALALAAGTALVAYTRRRSGE